MTWKRVGLAVAVGLVAGGTLLLGATPRPASAQAVRLFGTTGYGSGQSSTLVELDPDTGALIQTIGPVGYLVNGLTFDASTGRLFGGTSYNDPNYNGLIEIDMNTGAGTPIGQPNWGLFTGFTPVTNITTDSSGRMFGWYEYSDNLVQIDPGTGVATEVGPSGVGTYQNGLSFNNGDRLYMVNGGGDFYSVDTASGAASYEGSVTLAHHGDFHPLTDIYYGLTWTYGSPRTLLAVDLNGQTYSVVGEVGDVHTLTFVLEQEPPTPTPTRTSTATPTRTPAATATPGAVSVGGVAIGSIGSGSPPAAMVPADSGTPWWLAGALTLLLGAVALVGGAHRRRSRRA